MDFIELANSFFSGSAGNVADYRCRLSAKPGAADFIYGPDDKTNILWPLHRTMGLVFPFTPVVSVGATVSYEEYAFTHSIYRYNSYNKSAPNEISISGDFTAQTINEAKYLLAVMHFLKSASKSYFGASNAQKAGIPPPVLHFNYLGENQFKNVPVIIKNYSYVLDSDVDYVKVEIPLGFLNADNSYEGVTRTSWIPTRVNISITIDPYYNPNMLRDQFDLDKFIQGKCLGDNKKSREGFL